MCFDLDSHPPIVPIAGGALDSAELTLSAADGNRFAAFLSRPTGPTDRGIIVLPDVRGLHPYYEELALRFAETGVTSLAMDYFGRTAGVGKRLAGFEYMPHVTQTTWRGLSADITAAATYLRSADGGAVSSLFTIGFCFGGRLSFLSATLGLSLAGAIGFYGWPTGQSRHNDTPAPAEIADKMTCPILGIFGGADEAIPPAAVETFEVALAAAGVPHEIETYPNAPHSFFDKKADEFATTSEKAWQKVREFLAAPRGATELSR